MTLRVHEALNEVSFISRNFYGVVRVREYGRDEPRGPRTRADPRQHHARPAVPGAAFQEAADQLLQPESRASAGCSGRWTIGRSRSARWAWAPAPSSAYGKAGDHYRFYEIDEAIVSAAHQHFSFIADSPATVDVAVGDGRLLLQDEADAPLRRAGGRCLLGRLDPGAPAHARGRGAVPPAPEARRRDRAACQQQPPGAGAGGRPHCRRTGPADWRCIADAGVEGDAEHVGCRTGCCWPRTAACSTCR